MKNNNTFPIGVFDSGLGGLSILNEIAKRLPHEQLIYLADSNNAPYGEKPLEVIIDISKRNTEFLLDKQCKLIVVACNTATTNAIDILRKTYDVPFIGIEPAIKPALLNSKSGKVGVLATKGTLSSDLFAKTSKQYSNDSQIIEVVGKGIVEAIESNATNTIAFDEMLSEQLSVFNQAQVDFLVLGCSHYPFIKSHIQKHLGEKVKIIDSGFAVARQTQKILEQHALKSSGFSVHQVKTQIYANGTDPQALKTILAQLDLKNVKHFPYNS